MSPEGSKSKITTLSDMATRVVHDHGTLFNR